MKIFVLPRENSNPYQSLLYKEMESLGAQVVYGCSLTPSHTLNQLLLPIETLVRRMTGVRVAHIHWTYGFAVLGSHRHPTLRRISQALFYLWLWTVRISGIHLVWTAHNTLPIGPRFVDDVAARKRLVTASDLVISHSAATLAELAQLGIVPRKSVVIPHGPYEVTVARGDLRTPGAISRPRKFLFFGVVDDYKGVDTLLAAFAQLPPGLAAELMVAGECRDSSLRASLAELARRCALPVSLQFERVAESTVSKLLEDADVMVLPYRLSTTSGSAVLALSHGRPLIVPDLPGLATLPDEAVIRYDRTVDGLVNALTDLSQADADVLAKMSDAGYAYCESISWSSIARKTFDAMSLTL